MSGSSQVNANTITNFDSNVKDKLNTETVISGSEQVNLNHLDTGDLAEGSNLYYTDARVKTKLNTETVISGSSQVPMGGDISGNADNATVDKVKGVSITSGEASQVANINSVTISNTQWGYLGSSNQGIATSDTVQFAKVGVGGSSDATYELKVTGDVGATGDIVAFVSSDKRLKDNIQPIEGALDKVSQISGNTFDWNEEKQNIYKGKDYGVIAQEIQEVMPELVDTRDNGYLAVKYDKIVPLLIESIK